MWESFKERARRFSVDSIRSRLSPTKSYTSSRANSPAKSLNFLLPLPTDTNQPQEEPIRVKLSDIELVYQNGRWAVEGWDAMDDKVEELLEKNRTLEGENQLLKFKVAYLLDLLATTKLDALQLQAEKK